MSSNRHPLIAQIRRNKVSVLLIWNLAFLGLLIAHLLWKTIFFPASSKSLNDLIFDGAILSAIWLIGLLSMRASQQRLQKAAVEAEETRTHLTKAELALRESEERYRTLVELSPEAVYVHCAGSFLFMNQAGAELFGATHPADLIGTSILERVHPEYRELVRERVHHISEDRQVAPMVQQRWLRVDGHEFDVVATGTQVQYDGKNAVLVLAHDVSALRRSEAELRKLSRAVEQSPVTIVITDAQGVIEYANPSFQTTTGYTIAEAIGQNPRVLNSGKQPREFYAELWGRIIAGDQWRGEFHNRKKNGELYWESATISPIKDDTGVITHYLAVKEEITHRKSAEERIREQAALLDVSRDAIAVLTLDLRITYWNHGAENLYGWTSADALAATETEKLYGLRREELTEILRVVRAEGRWASQQEHRTKLGLTLTIDARATLMRDEANHPKSVLLVCSDITERMALESSFLRSQRLESLGTLASGIAHDLNNVLSPILISVGFLRRRAQPGPEQESLQLISDSARRGSDIIKQLLQYSRGEEIAGGQVNVGLVIRDMGRMMQETFPRNLTISVQAPSDLHPVNGDRTRIHQVLLNLCINSRDAMPQGGQLKVHAQNLHVDAATAAQHDGARAGSYVRLLVEDTGTGIPAEQLERIFDPFFSTKPTGQGTGLGLPTVRSIVDQHRGFLKVESEVGVGTKFSVFLPAAGPATGSPDLSAEGHPEPLGGKELVLVVDDEPHLRKALQICLQENNYEVLLANNGAEALALAANHSQRLRLVITDVMMPVMDGAQLISALRLLKPNLAIIAISGLPGSSESMEKQHGVGVRYLSKPFSPPALLTCIRELLGPVVCRLPTSQ